MLAFVLRNKILRHHQKEKNIQSSFDTLGGSYSKQRLCNTSTEAS